jgi:tRNA threonylcarbamoyladenosine biosynthesis protein TsaB
MILTIRTDKPEAEVGVFSADGKELSYHTWFAHRELSSTLLTTIQQQLDVQKATFQNITGIVIFKGPGSFTGLRIGITVANTLAYGLEVPIVGEQGEQWAKTGISRLRAGANDQIVLPHYGSEAHITLPKNRHRLNG